MHVVALDMKTGEVAWDHEILDREKNPRQQMTGGPLVAKGKVIVGTGGQRPGRKYHRRAGCRHGQGSLAFLHHRAPGRTGRQQLERPAARKAQRRIGMDRRQLRSRAEPGLLRAGADLRHRSAAASGRRSPASPTTACTPTPRWRSIQTPASWSGISSTSPNDQWDLDWAFERQLIDLPVNGVDQAGSW